jgi:hypothetical protein
MNISDAQTVVENNFSSYFTKQDVLDLLGMIDSNTIDAGPKSVKLTDTQISSIANNIIDAIKSQGMSIVEDYELELNWKEVEVSEFTWDESLLAREIESAITEWQDNQIVDETE